MGKKLISKISPGTILKINGSITVNGSGNLRKLGYTAVHDVIVTEAGKGVDGLTVDHARRALTERWLESVYYNFPK